MTSGEAQAFADEWIAAWNSHDLDRVLSHYAPEVVFLSRSLKSSLATVAWSA
jgi:ketosteroid isomerase-like protein